MAWEIAIHSREDGDVLRTDSGYASEEDAQELANILAAEDPDCWYEVRPVRG